jgi:hypothetical protein
MANVRGNLRNIERDVEFLDKLRKLVFEGTDPYEDNHAAQRALLEMMRNHATAPEWKLVAIKRALARVLGHITRVQ